MSNNFNPLNASVALETSQLICAVNQLTGFFMRITLGFNRLTELFGKKLKFVNYFFMDVLQ